MKIYDMISICLRNLWRRKGRTMLTVIGVVIGSCAVIVMISLGLGMSAAMDSMLASFGDLTAVTVYNGERGYSSGSSDSKDKPKLDETAFELFKSLDHVDKVIPKIEVSSEMVTAVVGRNDRYKLSYGNIIGIDFSNLSDLKYEATEGKLPDPDEYEHCMIMGQNIPYMFMDTKKHGKAATIEREQLRDGSYTKPFFDPMKEKITLAVNNSKKSTSDGKTVYGGRGYEFKFENTGILKEDSMWETPYSLFIDINVAKDIINSYNQLNKNRKAGEPQYSQLKIVCDNIDNVDQVMKIVKDLGYNASSMAEVREQMQGELGVIQLILGGLAAISLLVAAISITNTMIMSIYERTKEIGIMKVLGCFIGNIRFLFLMEAGMIGLLGGIIGTIISYLISLCMNVFAGSAFSEMMGVGGGDSAISIIPLWLVMLALVFSTIIGLISGYYPANRAVKISALEAIRNE